MLALLFTSLIHSQSLYTPSLYVEQTKECRFPQTASTYSVNELIELDVLSMRRLYPLSTPLISQSSFLRKLGEALFKNEADCKNHNLTHWGKNEEFPSLGLPHAIWYGKAPSKVYQEQFPELVRFIRKNLKPTDPQISWPAILKKDPLPPATWASQAEFLEVKKISLEIENVKESLQLATIQKTRAALYKDAYTLFEIRHFLSNPLVIQLQAQFVIEKTFLSLHRILAASHRESPQAAQFLYSKIQTLLNSPEGVLAIVDYLNFKGEGLKASERTPVGKFPWGLKTVLEIMPPSVLTTDKISVQTSVQINGLANGQHVGQASVNLQFAKAALCALQRLAYHSGAADSPAQLQRYNWLNGGWKTRVDGNYLPNTFSTVRCPKNMPQMETQ